MNIFLYIIIFVMGTVFGSFYTLAVYRIPRKIDIIYTHSFCPNCNHKLGFLELIPVWSYILLGGKCKECKQKIRARYFILEFLSGLAFILIAFALRINIYNLEIETIIKFAFIILYLVAMFLIAGIDKEYKSIEKSVLYYGLAVSCSYIIYLCIMDKTSIHRYVMYLVTLIVLLILDSEKQITKAEESYLYNILILIVIMIINTGMIVTIISVLSTFLIIGIKRLLYLLKNSLNKSKKEYKDMSEFNKFGYLFSLTNVILFTISLY